MINRRRLTAKQCQFRTIQSTWQPWKYLTQLLDEWEPTKTMIFLSQLLVLLPCVSAFHKIHKVWNSQSEKVLSGLNSGAGHKVDLSKVEQCAEDSYFGKCECACILACAPMFGSGLKEVFPAPKGHRLQWWICNGHIWKVSRQEQRKNSIRWEVVVTVH